MNRERARGIIIYHRLARHGEVVVRSTRRTHYRSGYNHRLFHEHTRRLSALMQDLKLSDSTSPHYTIQIRKAFLVLGIIYLQIESQ